MHNRWYWAFKNVFFGPFLRVWNRPTITGLDNIPSEGPGLIASNHQAVMDSFYFPLMVPRQMTFPAKSEYFTTPGVVGRMQKWFFTAVGQIPVDRNDARAGDTIVAAAEEVFQRGDLFCIYPEGTRSPDGRVYKGRTGMARIALRSGLPIIPVAMIGSREANPIGSWIPRPKKVRMIIDSPIYPAHILAEQGITAEDREAPRAITDYVMHRLAELAGKPYVDQYASDVKASLEAGHGYPPGAEPSGR
ncbi:1-acyl-sn-glycerol-3-phosphate acyltransferase [Corynebacterium poyangense]|uniref:1-acyl-sn-glycerol-3-phosphate acyltransferase n=1 Tax=Corynebacterium poyangense TaxID=2684405 RepID=A0A7H0SSE4_9CORY|nr:lysophospholipid acyltransferase family protein [Corynebacterium poyangense]MBZ8178167.1 1-acyl-sn-glycerol-3-phosphate acyltransferase [Corynebacterium poyangense]QNQ91469.1 1-acyl-sn-glycerol-3-phosphate acyltransferase [Corynebacterium poyangense]